MESGAEKQCCDGRGCGCTQNQVRGPQQLNVTPPLLLKVSPRRQEVPALEADDFLWDGHALGLR